MRVVIVVTHPIQYQAPLFRKLAAIIDLTVVYLMRQTPESQASSGFGVRFDWDVPLLSGYRHMFAKNVAVPASTDTHEGIVLSGHEKLLDALKPDVLMVMGWFPKAYLQVIQWAEKRGVPLVCRGESNLMSGRSLPMRFAKSIYFRWLFRKFRAFALIGQRNREFYLHYGVAAERLHWAPYSIDTDFFVAQFQIHRPVWRKPGPWRLGFAGKLIGKKRPQDLLAAVARSGARKQIQIIIIGNGPMRTELEQQAEALSLDIEFRGFLNQSRIVSSGYSDIDALVLPSGDYETWGLVVNEVMTGGIPAIVSDKVGCAVDLVVEDSTGYVYRSGDVPALSGCLDRCVQRLNGGKSFSGAVLNKICEYAIDQTSLGIVAALRGAIADV